MTGNGAEGTNEPPGGPAEKAAASVSAGEPIPDNLTRSGDPQVDRVIENLRVIERIRQVHTGPPARDFAPAAAEPSPSRPSPADEPALFTWGHLRVLQELGQGTSSEVYRAWDPRLQIEVALKLRRSNSFRTETNRFLDEARRMAQVRHPAIVRVYGAEEHDGREGLWMDLVRGKTLKQYATEHGRLGPHEAALWGMEVCTALAALHEAGVVHRDVKPSNVMRDDGGHILLMDLGSASALHGRGENEWDSGGTPITMAPEVLLDNQTPGPAADVYGVGVLLYYLVTGRFPIEPADWRDLLDKHRKRIVTPLINWRADAPAAFVSVVERTLSRRPEDRYATAGDLHQALASTIGAAASEAASQQQKPPRPPIRLLVALIVIATAGAAAWAIGDHYRPRAFDSACRLLRTSPAGSVALEDGAVIRPGDELHVELLTNRPAYAWVFAEDNGREPELLFPLGGAATAPVRGDGMHRLPAAVNSGKPDHWVVTPGKRSQVVAVVCAAQPVPLADSLAEALAARAVTAERTPSETTDERGLMLGIGRTEPRDNFLLDAFLRRLENTSGVHTARFFLRYDGPATN